jgi:hypothetical protein
MNADERAKKAATGKPKTDTSKTNNRVSTSNKTLSIPKATDTTFNPTTVNPTIAGNVNFDFDSKSVAVELPGLPQLTIEGIAQSVKTITPKNITDVKNPGISDAEKADKAIFERAKNDYEDGVRYLQLVAWANTYKGEEYKVIASQAKAYQQGLIAASEVEKVYQQYLELAKQKQITTEKGVNYIAQSHKTATAQTALPYTIAENEATLETQRIKARRKFEEAKQANVEFDDWLTSLKGKQTVK